MTTNIHTQTHTSLHITLHKCSTTINNNDKWKRLASSEKKTTKCSGNSLFFVHHY